MFMKKLFFLLILPAWQTVCAQVDTAITYTYVHEVSYNKQKLFENAKKWIASTFNNYKEVVLLEDKEMGRLIGKGYTKEISSSLYIGAKFNFTIDVKDNKYRLNVDKINSVLYLGSRYGSPEDVPYTSAGKQRHIGNLKKSELKMDSLSKIDYIKLSKKELSLYNDAVLKASDDWKEDLRYTTMYDKYFISLDESLFKSMKTNDDF